MSYNEQIEVIVRVRPFLPTETTSSSPIILSEEDDKKIQVGKEGQYYQSYYDKVFSPNSTQEQVYHYITQYYPPKKNCTIIAYGQTGSGKTYTMFGKEWTNNENIFATADEFNFIQNEIIVDPMDDNNGIIPRMIYDSLENSQESIYCSYIQIYNEKIYDLLSDNVPDLNEQKRRFRVVGKNDFSTKNPFNTKPLLIREDKNIGIYIENLTQNKVETFFDCINYLKLGEVNRKKRQTSKNELSSRSHTIFMLSFISEKVSYRLNFCDLAGSEKFDKKFVYNKLHLNEMTNINRSLYSLGNVINALSNRKKYIPYRESKLTQLLQNSLGGSTKTFLIAAVSPGADSYEETLSTLKFADRARSVFMKVDTEEIDEQTSDGKALVTKLTKEVAELRQLLNIREKNGVINNNALAKEVLELKKENARLKEMLRNANGGKLVKTTSKIGQGGSSRIGDFYKLSRPLANAGMNIMNNANKNYLSPKVNAKTISGNSYENNNFSYSYKTRRVPAKKWGDVPNSNVLEMLDQLQKDNDLKLQKEIEAIKRGSKKKKFNY